jgi:hypothetical protein
LNIAKEDGTTEADSLNRAFSVLENKHGKAFDEKRKEIQAILNIPEMPEEYLSAWAAWSNLNSSRTSNGFSLNPISFTEISAYITLTQTLLLPYEIKGIKTIDSVFLKVHSDLSKASQASKAANKETTTRKSAPPRRR